MNTKLPKQKNIEAKSKYLDIYGARCVIADKLTQGKPPEVTADFK